MNDFKHKHSLGQNFLEDKKVLIKIIDSVDIKENDLVIEIGPGQGALTRYLKLYKSNLLCFEIDKRLENELEKYVDEKTKIVFDDFLNVDLTEFVSSYDCNKIYIIANLPYYITTPIIDKVINNKIDIEAMILMVQDEVADRLCAKSGSHDYGYMSVYLSYFYDVEKLFFVSRNAFYPVPNVDSAVIKLSKKKNVIRALNEELFFQLIKDAFKQKRKNLRNNLKDYDLEKIILVLDKYGLNLQTRAEQVPLNCFIEIADSLEKE